MSARCRPWMPSSAATPAAMLSSDMSASGGRPGVSSLAMSHTLDGSSARTTQIPPDLRTTWAAVSTMVDTMRLATAATETLTEPPARAVAPALTVVPPPERERVTRRAVKPATVLVIASLGVFMEFVDSTIVNIAFPSIRADFSGVTLTTLSWIFDAYSIVFAAFLVASGRLADLLGRKRLFQIGVVLFTLASALCAIAPSAGFLIAARALQALGGAMVVPASLALVVNAFPPERRTRALTAYGSSAAIAAA